MKRRRSSKISQLGMSPENQAPFFSAAEMSGGQYQEHLIFRRDQLDVWMQMYAKQIAGKKVTDQDVKAIEPAARLILRIYEVEFESKLLINTDLVSKEESETLIDMVGEAFQDPLDRDGTLLVYYTDTPYRYEWS